VYRFKRYHPPTIRELVLESSQIKEEARNVVKEFSALEATHNEL